MPSPHGFVPFPQTHYNARFYLDRVNGSYAIELGAKDDYGVNHYGQVVNITDDWQAIEIDWQAASAPGAHDGFIQLWLNDTLVNNIQNLDTDTLAISHIVLGSILEIPAGGNGSIYFDASESWACESVLICIFMQFRKWR